jgi:tetratricopeptide (TPR) repeat protein
MTRLLCLLVLLPLSASANLSDDLAERHFQSGLKLLDKGRPQDAMQELDAAAALSPGRGDIRAAQDKARGAAESPTPGPTPGQAALGADSLRQVQADLEEAREAYGDSDLDRTAQAWNRALALDKDNAEAKEGLGRLAEEAYKRDDDAPFDSSVADLYEAALREARKEHLVEARKKLDEAQSLNPSQAQVKALLDKIESGAYAQAGSRRADEFLREGGRALDAGEWAAARRAYGEALSLRPGDKAAQEGLASLKEKSKDAVADLLARASKAPDDASALVFYGQALAIDPDNAGAQKASDKAAERQRRREGQASVKERANALYNQGVDAWQSGQLALASQRFKEVLDLSPGDQEAQKALDTVRSKLGGQVDKDRSDALGLMKQGKALEDQGRLKEALEAYNNAVAKDSGLKDAADSAGRVEKELQGN